MVHGKRTQTFPSYDGSEHACDRSGLLLSDWLHAISPSLVPMLRFDQTTCIFTHSHEHHEAMMCDCCRWGNADQLPFSYIHIATWGYRGENVTMIRREPTYGQRQASVRDNWCQSVSNDSLSSLHNIYTCKAEYGMLELDELYTLSVVFRTAQSLYTCFACQIVQAASIIRYTYKLIFWCCIHVKCYR